MNANTGAPINAVMTPTGNSVGEMIVRAIKSQMIKSEAPFKNDRCEQMTVIRPPQEPCHMRNNKSDKADCSRRVAEIPDIGQAEQAAVDIMRDRC